MLTGSMLTVFEIDTCSCRTLLSMVATCKVSLSCAIFAASNPCFDRREGIHMQQVDRRMGEADQFSFRRG